MKITRIGPDEIFHRYLTPKWAFLPISGAGAAVDGGRFNRPGIEALYLSRSTQTAIEEYKQGASIIPPATLAAYKITLAEVADLSQGFDPNVWDGAWQKWDCTWRQIAASRRRHRRPGSSRTSSSPPVFAASCFHRYGIPAAPIWLSFQPTLPKAIMSRSTIPTIGCRATSHRGHDLTATQKREAGSARASS